MTSGGEDVEEDETEEYRKEKGHERIYLPFYISICVYASVSSYQDMTIGN